MDNGKIKVPSVLLTPVVVTAANIGSTVIKTGYTKLSDICVGGAADTALCKAQ